MAQNVPNPGNYVAKLGADIVALRNAYQTVLNDNTYITQMGGATFLEAAPFSFTAADANAWIAALGNFANLSAMVTAINNSVPTWGGN